MISQRLLCREFLPLRILRGNILMVNPIISAKHFAIRAEATGLTMWLLVVFVECLHYYKLGGMIEHLF